MMLYCCLSGSEASWLVVLISSMDKNFQQDIDNAWKAELEKRIQDIRFGKVKGVPAAEVFAKLREKYR